MQRCLACRGKKDIMGAGMIYHKCQACLGIGYIDETENNAEQDNIENTQNRATKENVDTSTPDSCKTKRKQKRKSTVGISKQDLSESEASQQSG